MKPYPMELRERVAAAVDLCEGSLRQVAKRFKVSVSFVTRLLRQRRHTGSLAAKLHGGGHPPAFNAVACQRLRQALHKQPDATLDELRQRCGVCCSLTAVWRTLNKLKLPRKKKSLVAQEQKTPRVRARRRRFQKKVAAVSPESLVIVDESGANTAMTRHYGRAPRGQRVRGTVPGQWQTLTTISAVRLSGVVASLVFEGATDTAAFTTYVEQLLVPQLQPGDVVIWDNLRPHQNAEVVRKIKATEARVLPAPPWSPDLMPIEKMWSKVKEYLRAVGARTTETLSQAIGAALDKVTTQDILGWFQSCGMCATQK